MKHIPQPQNSDNLCRIPVTGALLFMSKSEAIAGIARLEREGFTVVRCTHVYDPCSSETVYCGISVNIAEIPNREQLYALWEKIEALSGPDSQVDDFGAGPRSLISIWDTPVKKARDRLL